MAYPGTFHRLVLIGDLYDDIFNVTLSIVPTSGSALPAVTDTLLTAVADAVGTWFPLPLNDLSTGGLNFVAGVKLTGIKLNRINADGHYADPETKEHTYTSPIVGPAAVALAPQLTVVATLRGNDPRGRAGKGRMYWPPNSVCRDPGSDGRLAEAWALQHAKGVRNLLGILNDVYLTAGVTAVAGIASKAGTGAFQGVNEVTVGRVIDTMRSRRNKQLEEPVSVTM